MEAPGQAYAATWRDSDGRVTDTTFGGTLCWYPIKPFRLRIRREGFEHVLRCRACPGCREFERRRLAERFQAKYGAARSVARSERDRTLGSAGRAVTCSTSPLLLIRIWAPREEHAAISHKLHRRRGLELEPGFCRLGTGSFAVLARKEMHASATRALVGLHFRVEPIKLRRGRRAWRSLTAGILVAREAYGEQVKRWYVRGLPPAEREKWEVVKLSAYKPYDRFRGPRAWKDSNLVLVPPEIWAASRIDRKKFMRLAAHSTSPETATAIASEVMKLAATVCNHPMLSAPAQPALSREEVQAWYQRRMVRGSARTSLLSQSGSTPPDSGLGGYASSEHSSNSPPPSATASGAPEQLELSGKLRWLEIEALKARPWQELTVAERGEVRAWEREQEKLRPTRADQVTKDKRLIADWLARMKAKVKGAE